MRLICSWASLKSSGSIIPLNIPTRPEQEKTHRRIDEAPGERSDSRRLGFVPIASKREKGQRRAEKDAANGEERIRIFIDTCAADRELASDRSAEEASEIGDRTLVAGVFIW